MSPGQRREMRLLDSCYGINGKRIRPIRQGVSCQRYSVLDLPAARDGHKIVLINTASLPNEMFSAKDAVKVIC